MKKKFKKIKNLNSNIFALYGASGAAAGIMPFAKLLSKGSPVVFIDDDNSKKMFMGIDVLSFNEFLALKAEKKFVSITISSPKIRKLINHRLKDNDILDWSIHYKNLIKMHNVKIGGGYLISPYVTFTSNIIIGKYFHANLYSYVEHDCIIGDFVTFAPGVKCNGNIIIQDEVHVGSGAVIKNGTKNNPIVIGKGSIIGAGAVVTKSVKPYSVMVGNPAKEIIKKN
jgi:sugar O-acyltransferase (sialic acid O-acetyltransferase NeuD family)